MKRNHDEILLGDWEIVSINNDIYGVYDNGTKKLLHVSKYIMQIVENSFHCILWLVHYWTKPRSHINSGKWKYGG